MIDIRKLKELVRLMVENDLSELDLQDQQETVTIKRGQQVVGPPAAYVTPAGAAAPAAVSAASIAEASDEPAEKPQSELKDTTGLVPVVSPMVGTVYLSPNPDSPSYVTSGSSIGPDSTVCLIEAMKVFSEIKAETSGTIERVLVTSGQAVQYGQQLFLVRPQ